MEVRSNTPQMTMLGLPNVISLNPTTIRQDCSRCFSFTFQKKENGDARRFLPVFKVTHVQHGKEAKVKRCQSVRCSSRSWTALSVRGEEARGHGTLSERLDPWGNFTKLFHLIIPLPTEAEMGRNI